MTRQIKVGINMDSPKYAIRVLDKVPDIGGLFIVESTPNGEQIRLFETNEEAVEYAKYFKSVEVVEYVNEERE